MLVHGDMRLMTANSRTFRLWVWYLHNFAKPLVLIFPSYLIMMSEQGIDSVGLGTLLVIWSAGVFAFEIPTGILGDLFKRRDIIVISGLFDATAFATWLIWPTFTGYAIGFLVWSAGIALHSGTAEAYLFETLDDKTDFEKVYGRTQAAIGVGVSLSLLLGGFAVELTSFQFVLGLSVVAPLVASSIGQLGLPHAPNDGDQPSGGTAAARSFFGILRQGMQRVMESRALVLLVCVTATLITLPGVMEEYVGVLTDELGFSLGNIGIIYSAVWLSRTAGNMLAHRLVTDDLTLLLGLFAGASAFAFATTFTPAAFLLAGLFVYYFVDGIVDVLVSAKLQALLKDAYRATVTSFMSMAVELVAIVYFLSLGYAAGLWGWTTTLACVLGGGVVLALIWLVGTFILKASAPSGQQTRDQPP